MGYPMAGHLQRAGHQVTVYNRTAAKTDEFMAKRAPGKNIVATKTLQEFVEAIMDRLVFALIFATPAIILATVFRWLDIEYALGIVWAGVLLIVALGLSKAMREGADA